MRPAVRPHRKRNAAVTRALLLEAATSCFALQSYDTVALRNIAGEAGVDVALIARYFGSKEELFAAVLLGNSESDEIFKGERTEFGRRVARLLVHDPLNCRDIKLLMIVLRSAGDPSAVAAIRNFSNTRFLGRLEELCQGNLSAERSRLIGSIIQGLFLQRMITDDLGLGAEERDRFQQCLAITLQTLSGDA